jgi:hypothetical protein
MAPLSGWLYDRTRSPLIAPLAMTGIAGGLTLLGLKADHLDFLTLGLIGVPLSGFVGLFMTANNTAIMGALPHELKGFASGMLETARQMGHGLAVPIVSAVLLNAVARESGSLGTAGAYLIGYQQAVLLMAALCVGGVVATIAGSLSRAGWETRAAAPTPQLSSRTPQSWGVQAPSGAGAPVAAPVPEARAEGVSATPAAR